MSSTTPPPGPDQSRDHSRDPSRDQGRDPSRDQGRDRGQRYHLDARIATGGMGEVWRATDTVLGREVAVKVLKPEYAGDPTFRSRFETEARNAAALHHPNVASVFDFGELPPEDGAASGRAFLVMELVRGEPLSALLRGGERMPAATAAALLTQVADGLAAAHDLGMVHRDVKPGNLLVTPDRTVKITDFGIARAANAVALTQTGQVVGTPQYLSPEQAEGKPATAASDIYSLGVVLYECLAGQRPFGGDSAIATALAHLRQEPPPLPEDVPASMRETVRIALAKKPADRFASVRDFAVAMRGGDLPHRPVPVATDTVQSDAPTRLDRATAFPPGPGTAAGAAVGAAAAAAAAAGTGAGSGTGPVPGAGTGPVAGTRTGGDRADGGPRSTGADRPSSGGVPGWLPWVALALVAVVAVVLFLTLRGRDSGTADDPGTGSASPTEASSPTEQTSQPPTSSPSRAADVDVNEDDYVGRPRAEVRAALVKLGLKVTERSVANPGDEAAGTVAGVNPSGTVQAGSRVTLSYFGEPAATPTPSETQSESPSPSASPTLSPTPSASASPTDEDSGAPSTGTGQDSGGPSTGTGQDSGGPGTGASGEPSAETGTEPGTSPGEPSPSPESPSLESVESLERASTVAGTSDQTIDQTSDRASDQTSDQGRAR